MLESLDHVGIAVHNLQATLEKLKPLLSDRAVSFEEVASQKVKVAFVDIGNVRLELLETTDPQGPVGRFLEKCGEGLHHLSFGVTDIAARLQQLSEAGVQLVDRAPRPGAGGHNVAFLHPRSTGGILIELCEPRH